MSYFIVFYKLYIVVSHIRLIFVFLTGIRPRQRDMPPINSETKSRGQFKRSDLFVDMLKNLYKKLSMLNSL